MNYKKYPLVSDRDAQIMALCSGKSVLHIGACDAPYTKEKLLDGLHLHKNLTVVARELLGVDIDDSSIAFLSNQGINNIVHCKFSELESLDFSPEVIIFGETIEHLENPGLYLESLKGIMSDHTQLVISTPNCYSLKAQFKVFLDKETIHPDHRLGFSAALLAQLLDKMGFRIESLYFTFLPRKREGNMKYLWRLFCCFRRGWAETLLVVALPNGKFQ